MTSKNLKYSMRFGAYAYLSVIPSPCQSTKDKAKVLQSGLIRLITSTAYKTNQTNYKALGIHYPLSREARSGLSKVMQEYIM